jgi:hypothetical protein
MEKFFLNFLELLFIVKFFIYYCTIIKIWKSRRNLNPTRDRADMERKHGLMTDRFDGRKGWRVYR